MLGGGQQATSAASPGNLFGELLKRKMGGMGQGEMPGTKMGGGTGFPVSDAPVSTNMPVGLGGALGSYGGAMGAGATAGSPSYPPMTKRFGYGGGGLMGSMLGGMGDKVSY